jgi:PAS domain-containing protein
MTVEAMNQNQHDIEVILLRQLASYLAMPLFIVDPAGTLLFYNEPAEAILGRRFEETGELSAAEWATAFHPTDEEGEPLPAEKLPLTMALSERRSAHGSLWIHGFDHVRRHIEITAIPLVGQSNRFLGAVAIFWSKRL